MLSAALCSMAEADFLQASQSADVELVEELGSLERQLDALPPAQQTPEVGSVSF